MGVLSVPWPPLTVVSGPAGIGKSHAVRAAIDPNSSIWIDARAHRHSVELAGHLVRRLHARLGGFPPELIASCGSSCGPIAHTAPLGRAEQLGASVAGALDSMLEHDLVVVIDGVDQFDDTPGPTRFLETLVRTCPARLQLVLITRTSLRFSIGRMRDAGRVREITQAALALPHIEAQRLSRATWQRATAQEFDAVLLDDHIEDELLRRAEGVPGRIVAMTSLLATVEVGEQEQELAACGRDAGRLEVLQARLIDRLEDGDRLLLDDIVVLAGASTVELQRLGHSSTGTRVDRLAALGLVDCRSDAGDWITASRLVADCVRTEPDRTRRRADAAARVAIERGDPRAGLCAAMFGDADLIATSLLEIGTTVIEGGDAQLVLDAISLLPDARAADFAGLSGRAFQSLGDWNEALQRYEQVPAHRVHISDAWRHGLILYLQGDAVAAMELYREAMASDAFDDGATRAADRAMLMGYAVGAAWIVGDVEAAREYARRALTFASSAHDDAALAVAHTGAAMVSASDGDRVRNEWHYGRALNHAERAGDMLQIGRIRTNRGSRLMEEGEFPAALVELDRAVRAADVGSYGAVLALALSNRGEVLTKLGRLDEARTDLTTSFDLLLGLGSRMVSYPLACLARLFLARGDTEQAIGACERALAEAGTTSNRQSRVAARMHLARALQRRDLAEAWNQVMEATKEADGSLDEAELWSVVSMLAAARDDRPRAVEAADTAARLARQRRDRFALASAIEASAMVSAEPLLRVERLAEARSLFAELGCVLDAARVDLHLAEHDSTNDAIARATTVAELGRRLGARPLVTAANQLHDRRADEPEPELHACVLGAFSVSRNGEDVPASEWQSRKARDLFKMLIARRGRPVPRDQAIEFLWPDDDSSRSPNRLSAVVATIRSVVDPDKQHDAGHFIGSDANALWVMPTVSVDAEHFLELASVALHPHDDQMVADAMLAIAEASYTGDPFEDDPYEDWFVAFREEARAVYLSVARSLAERFVERGESDDAIRMYLRMIEREPYDEGGHLGLIAELTRTGRHGDARRRYRYYATQMRELSLEPRPFPR